MRKKKNKVPDELTMHDVDFIDFSLSEHLSLIGEHHGAPWNGDIELEERLRQETMDVLKESLQTGTILLNDVEYAFIEYSLGERGDFAAEDIGTFMCSTGKREAIECSKILNKLRVLFNLAKQGAQANTG